MEMAINTKDMSRYLFSDRLVHVYTILDGAAIDDLPSQLEKFKPEYICLYRGELAPDLAQVAPYLARIIQGTEFTEWIVRQGWGKNWGIFARSLYSIRHLRQHFRSLLTIYTEEGKPLLFRYYDPRVLNTFLPTCNGEELEKMFGPVESFLLEDEEKSSLVRFRHVGGILKKETRKITTLEEEQLAQEAAKREKMRQELMPTARERPKTAEDLNKSLVNFWTTLSKFKPDKEDK